MEELIANINGATWFGIVAAAILLGERIAKLTPTNTDNKVLRFIRKAARAIGLDFPDRQ